MKTAALALVILATSAGISCTPTVDIRGNNPSPEALAQIKPGTTTRDEAQAILGTPSAAMTYGDETWQYISSKTETVAFFKPELKERRVVVINFDKNGVVRNVGELGPQDGLDVPPVTRETESAGKKLTILEQLVGNIGRFSKDTAGK